MKILKFLLLTVFWVYFPIFVVWSLLWLHSFHPVISTVLGVGLPSLAVAIYLWRVAIVPFHAGISEAREPIETVRPCSSDR